MMGRPARRADLPTPAGLRGGLIYLDYSATTPVHPRVIDAVLPYLTTHFGNPSSGHHYAEQPRRALATARQQVARLISVGRIASTVARLAGLPDPSAHAEKVVAAFLPDIVRYQSGVPAMFEPGGGNGRALGDDSFDIAVEFLAGSRLGNASTPGPATPEFPYLSPPQPADLPALADLFGLRSQHSEQTSSTGSHVPERASLT